MCRPSKSLPLCQGVLRTALLGILGLGLSYCGADSDSVVLLIHVKNLTSDVTALHVSAALNGKPAMQRAEYTQQLDEVAVKLSRTALGQGPLRLDLFGMDSTLCTTASAHYDIPAGTATAYTEIDLSLGPLSNKFCLVPKGSFTMGSPPGESTQVDEVQHMVTLTTDFLIAETEVRQSQYLSLIGTDPSQLHGNDFPVEFVSWLDAVAYCNRLSKQEGLEECYQTSGTTAAWTNGIKCLGYRLPTEAEWEYAARAPQTETTQYAGSDSVDGVAWYLNNSTNNTHPVKTKTPNGRGLYDLSGNVAEWVWDLYKADYQTLPPVDPVSPMGSARVYRGGAWNNPASNVRVAFRQFEGGDGPQSFRGFRVVRSYP